MSRHDTTYFVTGWNMPGYMPDCEPSNHYTFNDAKQSLVETIESHIPDDGDESAYQSAIDDVDSWDEPDNHTITLPNGLIYWLHSDDDESVWYEIMLENESYSMESFMNDFDDNAQSIRDIFDTDIKPSVIEQYGADDVIAIREAFNGWTDMLCKDGDISTYMYENIIYD